MDDCSSEEGHTGLIHAGVEEAASPSAAPDMHADEIAPTEMDPAMTPREKCRVPGSPPPLDIEAGLASGMQARSPLSGHLRSMPSPLRTIRRSLSPREARDRGSRLNAATIPENDRDAHLGESRNLMEDSLMGTSPCTEHSMDSLASFFRDGHYYVPLRLSSVDEPLAEPAQHPREAHSDRPLDTSIDSCEHGTPCMASFPCPLSSGGPGRVMPAQGGTRRLDALPAAPPALMGVTEPPPRPMRDVQYAAIPCFPDSQELRMARSGVPRIPAPTESVDMPSSERRYEPSRPVPCPSQAPLRADAAQGVAAMPTRHVPSSVCTAGDARPAEEPGRTYVSNPVRASDVPTPAATAGIPPATGSEHAGLTSATEGPGRHRLSDAPQDLRTSGPMPPQPALPTGGMLSMSSMATPSLGFVAPGPGHVASMPVQAGVPPAARLPAAPSITQGAQPPPYMCTSSAHAGPPFQRDFVGVGIAPPPQALPKTGMPPARPWGTQGPMAAPATWQAPWPAQPAAAVPPVPSALPPQATSLQAPVQPVRAEAHTAGRMPPAAVTNTGGGQGIAPAEPTEPAMRADSQGPAQISQEVPAVGSKSSGPIPASAVQQDSQAGLPPAPESVKDTTIPEELPEVVPALHGVVPHETQVNDSKSPPRSPLRARSPSFAAGVPDLDQDQITTPPPPEMIEKGQQTTPEKAVAHRRKRAAPEKLNFAKESPFSLVKVGVDKLKCLNQQGRPRRHQIRVLEHWRNERVLYERVRGSTMPTVCGVVVAQPCEPGDEPQERIPIGLTARFDDAFSPCSTSKMSDTSFKSGGLDQENAAEPVQQAKAAKARRPRRRVELAAKAASAAAASALTAEVPQRALPRRTPTGFVEVPTAEGSTHAVGIRVGLENGKWMCCDIRIPPRSFNTPEELAASKSILIFVVSCEPGTLTAAVDLDVIDLSTGHSLVIRPGQEYCLRNSSAATTAQLKMVMINQMMP